MADSVLPVIDVDFVVARGKVPVEAARLLVEGASKSDLEALFEGGKEEREVGRMNLVGGLRSVGFEILGGRKGGDIYKIIGWSERPEQETIRNWSNDDLSTKHRVESSPVISKRIEPELRRHMSRVSEDRQILHENSVLQLLSYEAGSGAFFTEFNDGRACVVVRKFKERPIWKIVNLDASPRSLLNLAQELGSISYKPVRIVNLDLEDAQLMRSELPQGQIETAKQAIVETREIVEMKGWSKTDRWNIRRNAQDTEIIVVKEGGEAIQHTVIDEWRKIVEKKQRQLSITRDYNATFWDLESKTTFLGFRSGLPVCLQIVDENVTTSPPRIVSQLVEKSLNYRSQPGGRSGTADFNLWSACDWLWRSGVELFNLGHIAGGTEGLASHKMKVARHIVTLVSFRTPFQRG